MSRHPSLLGLGLAALLTASIAVGSPAAHAATTTYSSSAEVPIGLTTEVATGGGIAIDDAPIGTVQPARPYASYASVSGLVGDVSKVVLELKGFDHTAPGDVDVMLVSPDGRSTVVMSDVGGAHPIPAIDLTFDDSSAPYLSDATLVGGSYHPANAGQAVDTFPAPAPTASTSPNTALSELNGSSPNGVWSLYVVDDAYLDSGSISGWSVTITSTGSDRYPSTIAVSGAAGSVTDVNVRLNLFWHVRLEDVDLLLVGPQGQQATILSDIPQTSTLNESDIVLDDAAPSSIQAIYASGRFKPTNHGAAPDDFAPPAPVPATVSSTLSVFNGTDANGTWRLYAADDRAEFRGGITSGWSLEITTADPTGTPTPTAGGAGGDTASPRVAATRPGTSAKAVRRGADITATLTEAARPGTVTRATAYLVRKGSTKRLAATVTYRPGTRQVVLDPAKRLRAGTTYRAVITTAVKDRAGNRLDQDPTRTGLQAKTWRFTTR